jgi:hypothetical protein
MEGNRPLPMRMLEGNEKERVRRLIEQTSFTISIIYIHPSFLISPFSIQLNPSQAPLSKSSSSITLHPPKYARTETLNALRRKKRKKPVYKTMRLLSNPCIHYPFPIFLFKSTQCQISLPPSTQYLGLPELPLRCCPCPGTGGPFSPSNRSSR